jgi:hypothetical protein
MTDMIAASIITEPGEIMMTVAWTEQAREALGSPAQVARHLQVPEKTLAEWRSRQIGPRYHRVGRYVRYAWADVDVWLATQAHGGGDAA